MARSTGRILRNLLLPAAFACTAAGCAPERLAAAEAPDCSIVVDRGTQRSAPAAQRTFHTIKGALDAAAPGDTVCVRSTEHDEERLVVNRSGTASAPIRIRAEAGEPVVTAGFVIKADYIELEGFSIRTAPHAADGGRGYGIYIAGRGVKVVGNSVTESLYDGIGCELYPPGCIDVTVARNIVRGANGSGIVVGGRRVVVEGNEVYGSVLRRDQLDADGIRFFGEDLTLRDNYVRNISAAGYPPGEEPHTDCFQTFDDSKPSSTNVLIEGNVCDNVDAQCLIATALTKKQSNGLIFRNNFCRVSNTQAILLRAFPQVVIAGNLFTGPVRLRAILLADGSTHGTVRENVFQGSFLPFELDDVSRLGFSTERNVTLQ